jgi:putative ABC transport system permease protein
MPTEIPKEPPRWPDRLLSWLVAPHLREEILGDMHERYQRRAQRLGEAKARQLYGREVLAYVRLSVIKRRPSDYPKPTNTDMLRNYFKIGLRNLAKNRVYSFINIFGLATGMAVAMLIGLWMYDELSFDKHTKNYDRIAQLWQFVKFDAEKSSYAVLPIPLAGELRSNYPDFESVSLAVTREIILDAGDRKFTKIGKYVEPVFTKMMSVNMLAGTDAGLNDVNSVLLSESLATAFFGSENPINKLIKIGNKVNVSVAGVYKDFPRNSAFNDISFLAPWKLFVATDAGAKDSQDKWDNNDYMIFAQLKAGADFAAVSAKIKDIRMKRDNPPAYKPEFFLHPMSKWHLYSDFKDGVNTGGMILFVWLFGIIGGFVLLLACINFMNLSTARSEKRAKEVGIRKAVGSVRSQLVIQFFSESLLLALLAFALSLVFVWFSLPFFNEVASKEMTILWSNPWFWLAGLSFSLLTGLIAGSYPAFYLSSFQAVKVLKGAFRVVVLPPFPAKCWLLFNLRFPSP